MLKREHMRHLEESGTLGVKREGYDNLVKEIQEKKDQWNPKNIFARTNKEQMTNLRNIQRTQQEAEEEEIPEVDTKIRTSKKSKIKRESKRKVV